MTKKEAYEFLLGFCREQRESDESLEVIRANCSEDFYIERKREAGQWQACVELLEAECPFHMRLLENQ